MNKYGYHPGKKTPGLWTHKSYSVTLTLVVEKCGVNNYGKEHALHLKAALESKYKVATDWYGKLYVGISLTCDYDK